MSAGWTKLVIWAACEWIFALTLMLVLMPVFLVLALCVRLDSSGPALFKQKRLGRGAKSFGLLKIRTMHVGVSNRTSQAAQSPLESGADPRITRVGRLLRRTSLDELPQLWNVVCGSMGLVGPRPILPEQQAAMPPWASSRFRVRPGLTGLAQIKGRRSLSWIDQLRWDRVFVRRDSIRLRVLVLIGTARVLVRSEEVYGDSSRNWRAWLPPADANDDES